MAKLLPTFINVVFFHFICLQTAGKDDIMCSENGFKCDTMFTPQGKVYLEGTLSCTKVTQCALQITHEHKKSIKSHQKSIQNEVRKKKIKV